MKICLITLVFLFAAAGLASGQDFSAAMTHAGVIAAGEVVSSEPATAFATFQLTTGAETDDTTLAYQIVVDAFDIDGTKTPELGDDITAIHLHTLTECAAASCVPGDTAGTLHVLNIFGVPREDDADLSIDVAAATISGVWDPSDANELTPAPSKDPNDYLTQLASQELFLMVHTRDFPGGAVGGVVLPEPSTLSLCGLCALGVLCTRRRDLRRLDSWS